MSRPKILNILNGKVSLQNFSKETSDKIEALLLTLTTKENLNAVEVLDKEEPKELLDKSIGMRYSDVTKQFDVVIIKYNTETNDSEIEQVIPAGNIRDIAVSSFTQHLSKLRII